MGRGRRDGRCGGGGRGSWKEGGWRGVGGRLSTLENNDVSVGQRCQCRHLSLGLCRVKGEPAVHFTNPPPPPPLHLHHHHPPPVCVGTERNGHVCLHYTRTGLVNVGGLFVNKETVLLPIINGHRLQTCDLASNFLLQAPRSLSVMSACLSVCLSARQSAVSLSVCSLSPCQSAVCLPVSL